MAYGAPQGLGLSWSDVTGAVKQVRQTFGVPAITAGNVIKAVAPGSTPTPVPTAGTSAIDINDPLARNTSTLGGLLTPTNIVLAGALAYAMMSSPRPRRVVSRRRRRR